MLKIFIRVVSLVCLALLPIVLQAQQTQQTARPALLTSIPLTVADLPVQSGRTGSLILLPESDSGAPAAMQLPDVVALLTRLQVDNVPFLSGDYADLQLILQQRDLLFWQLPVWTIIINLLSALVLMLVVRKEPGLPLLRWLFGFALAGNLYYLPAALALPVAVQLNLNALYCVAMMMFMYRLQQPVADVSRSHAGVGRSVFQAAVLLLVVLIGIDTLVLLDGLALASHPGMTLQLVPLAQIAGVLAALYFLTGRHAEMRAELQSLNASLDQRVAKATAELRRRYRELTRDALRAARMNERSGIYQTIHEDLGDKLLQLIYSAADTETSDLARSALAELRDSHNLLPDQQRPLTEVLADIRSETQNRCDQAKIVLSWQQDDRLPDRALNARQLSALSRTVREAFSNLFKHAQASAVLVTVGCQSDGRLVYSIGDNGKGMSDHASPGRGLINMRNRVAELGGTLVWSPAEGGGTLFEFVLPLQEDIA